MVILGIVLLRNLKKVCRNSYILILHNLKKLFKVKIRIIPTNPNGSQWTQIENRLRINKRDQQLLSSLICEIIVYMLNNLPYCIMVIYSTITANDPKSSERIRVAIFVTYLYHHHFLF